MQLDVMAHDAALGPGSTPYGLSLSLFLYLVSLSSVVATVFWAVVTPIATLKCCIWMPFQTIGVYNEEQLFAMMQRYFPESVTHIQNGSLN